MNKFNYYSLIFSLCIIVQQNCVAQENLKFNQSLKISGGVVPSGKVWKVQQIENKTSEHQYIFYNKDPFILGPHEILDLTKKHTPNAKKTSSDIGLPSGYIISSSSVNVIWTIKEFDITP